LIQIKECQLSFVAFCEMPRTNRGSAGESEKGNPMQYRTIVVIAASTILGLACVSNDALARGFHGGFHAGGFHAGGFHGGRVAGYHGGVYRGGVYRGGVYRGGVYGGWRPGVAAGVGAAAVGAAAVGAAAAGSYYNNYYNSAACGYYPYPPCY
jgi:hypothetical protein